MFEVNVKVTIGTTPELGATLNHLADMILGKATITATQARDAAPAPVVTIDGKSIGQAESIAQAPAAQTPAPVPAVPAAQTPAPVPAVPVAQPAPVPAVPVAQTPAPTYTKEQIASAGAMFMLQMCLCLRRLRSISIDSHEMTITDTETERKIKLDGTEYRFRRYELPFTANQEALQEIRERTNHVSEQQRITCYVPIDKKESEYPLYVGLPTTHRIRIPVVIDAPFELTTSREQINTDFRRWNVLVRRKVYEAVLQMMLHRRNEDGERIFRFVRILARREGTAQVYKNVFSDCEFLNQHPILSDLKQAEILPTFAAGTYARPDGRSALVYPPYNSLCNSSKSHQITISFQTSQHNSNRVSGHELPSERHALCVLQAFRYAYADVLTGYEGPCVQTHPPAAANLPSLTGSSAARRSPQFLRSACPHLGAASAPVQGHSPLV